MAAATTTPANSVLPAPAPTPMRRPVDSARTAPAPTRTHLPVGVARQMAALPAGDIVGGAVGAGAGWSYNTGSCPKSCLWYARIFVLRTGEIETDLLLSDSCCWPTAVSDRQSAGCSRSADRGCPYVAALPTFRSMGTHSRRTRAQAGRFRVGANCCPSHRIRKGCTPSWITIVIHFIGLVTDGERFGACDGE